jgi:hypothetical protein
MFAITKTAALALVQSRDEVESGVPGDSIFFATSSVELYQIT